jgi:hypothetical protein
MARENRSILVILASILGLLIIVAVVGTLLLINNRIQQPTTNAAQRAQATLTAVPTATTRPLTIIGTFQGTGTSQTSIFYTTSNWVLAWSCNPIIDGVSSSYPLSIYDEINPTGAAPSSFALVVTTCKPGNTGGMVGVFGSGEQQVLIGTADPNAPGSPDVANAPWKVVIEVPS